jgi:hypothetical protein
VQGQKLFEHEEQKEYNRKASAEEILQALQKAYSTQGDEDIKNSEKLAVNRVKKVKIQKKFTIHYSLFTNNLRYRPVALTARASDSKSEGWGFESLLACH